MEDFIVAKADKKQQGEIAEQPANEEQVLTEAQIKNQKRQEKLQQKKQGKAKVNKKDKKGEPKQKIGKSREVVGELKKVTWPSFGKVVKNTLLVIGIVLLATVALFLVDRLFSWIYQLLVSGTVTNWWF